MRARAVTVPFLMLTLRPEADLATRASVLSNAPALCSSLGALARASRPTLPRLGRCWSSAPEASTMTMARRTTPAATHAVATRWARTVAASCRSARATGLPSASAAAALGEALSWSAPPGEGAFFSPAPASLPSRGSSRGCGRLAVCCAVGWLSMCVVGASCVESASAPESAAEPAPGRSCVVPASPCVPSGLRLSAMCPRPSRPRVRVCGNSFSQLAAARGEAGPPAAACRRPVYGVCIATCANRSRA